MEVCLIESHMMYSLFRHVTHYCFFFFFLRHSLPPTPFFPLLSPCSLTFSVLNTQALVSPINKKKFFFLITVPTPRQLAYRCQRYWICGPRTAYPAREGKGPKKKKKKYEKKIFLVNGLLWKKKNFFFSFCPTTILFLLFFFFFFFFLPHRC